MLYGIVCVVWYVIVYYGMVWNGTVYGMVRCSNPARSHLWYSLVIAFLVFICIRNYLAIRTYLYKRAYCSLTEVSGCPGYESPKIGVR